MKLSKLMAGVAGAVALACVASAAQARTYDWTFTNTATGVVEGHGQLTTGAADGGGFDVTSLTGVLDDPTIGVNGGIFDFNPGAGNDGVFAWDNVVYTTPGPNQPYLDNLGLLFHVGGQEINIYNGTGGCCGIVYPGIYPNGDIAAGSSNNSGGDAGTFTLSVPEPATWAMMLLGVTLIGAGLRLTRRQDEIIPTAA
jgi:hypothetical protein